MDRLLFIGLLLTFAIAVCRPPSSAARFEPIRTMAAAPQPAAPTLLDSLGIAGACLIIDVDACRFRLYDPQRRLVRQGLCATGMDSTLTAPDGRSWFFATPRGVRRVHHKSEAPVWQRPDWYYIEEGLPIPAADDPARLERGMLGAYALDVGQGYLVHGSPYQRGMGERITHGCVRLAAADLQVVYATLQIGDTVVLQ